MVHALALTFALLPAVALAQADLVVTSATGPTTGSPGEMVPVKAVVANTGTAAAAPFKYTWFLSDNEVATISDQRLSPVGSVAALAQQTNVTQSDVVALPSGLTAGTYWLGVCVNYEAGATPEFGIPELSTLNNCTTSTTTIVISTGPVAIVTSTLPPATQYSPYGIRLQASGGDGSYAWTQTAGTLPPGITLSVTGDLQGTPASAGSFAFDVKVSSAGIHATAMYLLMVSTGTVPLVVVEQELPAAEFSRIYAADLVAVGGKPPYEWTLAPDQRLPTGLKLSREGQILGNATEVGDFLFGVSCTDSAGTSATRDLKIKVAVPATLRIATSALATGYLKQSYRQALQAVGGKPGYDWTLVRFQQLSENATEQDGTPLGNGKDPIGFPPDFGLKIEDGGNGVDYLQGVPKATGLFLLSLRVVDAAGFEDFTQLVLRINYIEGLAITTTALPDAFAGHEYQARLGHNGAKDVVVTFSLPCLKQATTAGMFTCAAADPGMSIPAGLVLETDGALRGTPTGGPGTHAFLVKITDQAGRQDVRSLSIKVRGDYTLEQPTGCSAAAGFDLAALMAAGLALWARRRR